MVILFDQYNMSDDIFEVIFATEQQVLVAKLLVEEMKVKEGELGITASYAHVQCLHCHMKNPDHPFQFNDTKSHKVSSNTCLKCHTQDMSPSWYQQNNKNLKIIESKIKKVACPLK